MTFPSLTDECVDPLVGVGPRRRPLGMEALWIGVAASCCHRCCPPCEPSLTQPGVLIGWRTVLSAAHCVGGFMSYSEKLFLKRGFVRVGGTKLSTGRVAKVRTAAACDRAALVLPLGQHGGGTGWRLKPSHRARGFISLPASRAMGNHLTFISSCFRFHIAQPPRFP